MYHIHSPGGEAVFSVMNSTSFLKRVWLESLRYHLLRIPWVHLSTCNALRTRLVQNQPLVDARRQQTSGSLQLGSAWEPAVRNSLSGAIPDLKNQNLHFFSRSHSGSNASSSLKGTARMHSYITLPLIVNFLKIHSFPFLQLG